VDSSLERLQVKVNGMNDSRFLVACNQKTMPLHRTDTPRVIWLFLSAVPLAVDFGLTYFGIWENNHFTRVTTGALFGAVAAIYVVPGLIELSETIRQRFKSEPPAVAGG